MAIYTPLAILLGTRIVDSMRWKWGNIPIPEAHVGLLAAGIIMHVFLPWRFFLKSWMGHVVGWPIVVAGLSLASWTVYIIKDMKIENPSRIVTTGPYARSRNPMYLAWTLINSGIAFIVNTIWPVAFLPGVLIYTHFFVVLHEERQLERKFGDEYRQYRTRVRRYF